MRSGNAKSAAAGTTSAAIDPLSHVRTPSPRIESESREYSADVDSLPSQHILKRTNTENTIPQRMRTANVADSPKSEVGTPASESGAGGGPARSATTEATRDDGAPLREKKYVHPNLAYPHPPTPAQFSPQSTCTAQTHRIYPRP